MNERSLKIYYEVATKLNMRAVAAKLYISQPAISQTIRELEEEFDQQFFDRIGKKLYLTHAGETFLHYARRILNLWDECQVTLREHQTAHQGKLNVGASTTIGIYILTDLVGRFQKTHPLAEFSLHIENTQIVADLILENRIDFAFVEGPVSCAEIVSEYFCGDELVLIVAADHPWSRREWVTRQDIEKERFIMRERGSGTREVVENALQNEGVYCRVGMELGNTEAIKKAVAAGLGISCISRRCIQREAADGSIRIIDIPGLSITRQLSLIYHRDKYLSNLFKSFIDFCKQAVQAETAI